MRGSFAKPFYARLTLTAVLLASANGFSASNLDTIGISTICSLIPSLNGEGVWVAQAEGTVSEGSWQVSPGAVSQPTSLFTWTASGGSSTNFPNAIGSESWHADEVGRSFYGGTNGVAPGVAHVDTYEAGYFYNQVVAREIAITPKVVNQSFIFGSQQSLVDSDYDDYAARYNTLFVSGVGNSGAPSSAATAYNGLGVAAWGGASSIGPTSDGRSKPDITAPAGLTSYSTPLVSGAAAILIQAGAREEGGPGTAAAATDLRAVKVLLLNGAVKPSGWTNGTTRPLDARHGAGVLNVLNSFHQLRGGKRSAITNASGAAGTPLLPPASTNNLPVRRGWELATLSNNPNQDAAHYYYFSLSSPSNRVFNLTTTLVWNRQRNQQAINDLDLSLYDASNGVLLVSSLSPVDNLEHLCVRNLSPGRYALQVLKNGALLKRVTASETYALAFEFGPPEAPQWAETALVDGRFTGRLRGEPTQFYLVQAATNWADWMPVMTNSTSAQGILDFADPNTNGAVRRFYRALQLP